MKRSKSLIINDNIIIPWHSVKECSLDIRDEKTFYGMVEYRCGFSLILKVSFKDGEKKEYTLKTKKMPRLDHLLEKSKTKIKKDQTPASKMLLSMVLNRKQSTIVRINYNDFKDKELKQFESEKENIFKIIKNMSSENIKL